MNASSGHPHAQTLAACLLSLGPGDACPLCGRPLERLTPCGEGRQLTVFSEREPMEGDLLVCPECGCEVAAEEDPTEPVGIGTLSVAA
jgi:hypothetical protein